jgi:exopolyphosphatase/guanosine-5'-triphosphate,3'-diphosphate pyrophosphatase
MSVAEAQTEVVDLLRVWERRPRHVFHVANLALQLFDQLAGLHGLGERDRLILEAAALLHDIGASGPGREEHHKESARLIREHAWCHFSPGEVQVMAQVARYHRKSLPQEDHEEFAAFSPEDQRRVEVLAALLRIADGLDRTHQRRVGLTKVRVFDDQIVVLLLGSPEANLERAGADKKADLARRVFQREVVFLLGTEQS